MKFKITKICYLPPPKPRRILLSERPTQSVEIPKSMFYVLARRFLLLRHNKKYIGVITDPRQTNTRHDKP